MHRDSSRKIDRTRARGPGPLVAAATALRAPFRAPLLATLVAACMLPCHPAEAQTPLLPSGFSMTQVGYGPFFTFDPVGFALLPDGRVLLVEKQGRIRVNPVGVIGSTVIHAIADVTSAQAERGLTGIAVDPGWPARPWIYVYFTHASGFVRLAMLEASGDLSDPASTSLSFGNEYLLLTDIPDDTELHQGGTLRFGPDGMLYVSIGDDGWGCRPQDLALLSGKMLRLDVSAMPGGSGPPPKTDLVAAGNPFAGPGDNEKLVWAWGLRNPFRFTIDPLTGDLFLGDVGTSSFDEWNVIPYLLGGGENFGWPQYEGFDTTGTPFDCGEGNTFTDPAWAYPNVGATAITGGPIVRTNPDSSASLPSSYEGSVFVFDFFHGWARRLVPDGGSAWVLAPPVVGQPTIENWAEKLYWVSDAQVGLDGALYINRMFADQTPAGVFRIRPSAATGVEPAPESLTAAPVPRRARILPNPTARATHVQWTVRNPGEHVLEIYGPGGRLVRRMEATLGLGIASVPWDGRLGSGSAAPAGTYFIQVLDPHGETWRGRISIVR